MGLDHWIVYEYHDNDGDLIEHDIVEWRKQYWINNLIIKYLGCDGGDDVIISLNDIIGIRNFFQLCVDYPKLRNIPNNVDKEYISIKELIRSIIEINDFLVEFEDTELTGEFKYIISW